MKIAAGIGTVAIFVYAIRTMINKARGAAAQGECEDGEEAGAVNKMDDFMMEMMTKVKEKRCKACKALEKVKEKKATEKKAKAMVAKATEKADREAVWEEAKKETIAAMNEAKMAMADVNYLTSWYNIFSERRLERRMKAVS